MESDVVSTEAGGITQVIRAWSVKRDVIVEKDGQEVQEDRYITFLDTPGHEAFTKMRARVASAGPNTRAGSRSRRAHRSRNHRTGNPAPEDQNP